MANTVIQEWTDEKGWIHRIEIPLVTFFIEHDLEPVVRCKDCKWRGEPGCAVRIVDESDIPKDDDFCSWGERREDG